MPVIPETDWFASSGGRLWHAELRNEASTGIRPPSDSDVGENRSAELKRPAVRGGPFGTGVAVDEPHAHWSWWGIRARPDLRTWPEDEIVSDVGGVGQRAECRGPVVVNPIPREEPRGRRAFASNDNGPEIVVGVLETRVRTAVPWRRWPEKSS